MNRFDAVKRWTWSVFIVGFLAFAFAGCDGDTGPQGPQGDQGPQGEQGPPGNDGLPGTGIDPNDPETIIASATVESCGTCHGGVGEGHQAVYDEVYNDKSNLTLTIDSVSSVDEGAGTSWTVTVGFTITKTGDPLYDAGDGLADLDQKRFYAVQYDSVAGQYLNSVGLTVSTATTISNGNGTYVLTATGVPYAPETPAAPYDGAQVYGYIAEGSLVAHEGGTGAEIPDGSHVHLYDNVSNAAFPVGTAAFGAAGAYESAANVAGCQKCHGTPYLKHGYRAAIITDAAGDTVIPDFAACKSCHYDDRAGSHRDWSYMVDRPLDWATGVDLLPGEYDYTANVMNDVHLSHAKEFPYPQSMQNCATCHEGKLDQILADEYFTIETCTSCHSTVGTDAWPLQWDANGNVIVDNRGNPVPEIYGQPHRAPALEYLWFVAGVDDLAPHQPPYGNCIGCHSDPNNPPGTGFASLFSDMHTGYDVNITNAAGERYSDLYNVQIESITAAGDTLTIDFTANNTAIVPNVLVSFYGWNTKQFIVASHTRDNSTNCGTVDRPSACRMEYTPESAGGSANGLFTENAGSVLGDWSVTLDMAAYVPIAELPETIPAMNASGKIKKVEVTVAPTLNLSDLTPAGEDVAVALRADNETYDLVGNLVVPDYFKGAAAVVDTDKCNVCHDALASSFHDGSGRNGDGIEICKNCHVTTSGGSHLEMASRAIDSYVHAIHTFQAFDVGDVFKDENDAPRFDPVLAKRYDMHTKHVFPNFTIRNCEACHVTAGDLVDPADTDGPTYPVVYNVPDQAESMPGLLSASDEVLTWYEIIGGLAVEKTAGRKIGTVPEYVVGPASRACGGCHRARLIRDDAPGALGSFNAHTDAGGTLAENVDDSVIYGIIDRIMSMFE